MSKHILDTNHGNAGATRTAQFARIEADKMPSPQTMQLQRRPLRINPQTRSKRFVEIARRGEETV